MANCELYLNLISELLDGELSPEQECELRAHIDQCEDCKKVYNAFSAISQGLSEDLVQPPEMLAKGIMFKINAQAKGNHPRRFAFGRFTAVAACLVVVMFGASHFGLFDTMKSKPPEPASAGQALRMAGDENAAPNISPVIIDPGALIEPGTFSLEGLGPVSPAETPTPNSGSTSNEDGVATQFGTTFEEIITNTTNSRLSPAPYIPQLLLTASEVEVYSGNYHYETDKIIDKTTGKVAENKLLLKLNNKDALEPLVSLLKAAVKIQPLTIEEPIKDFKSDEAVYSLIIPNASENAEKPTSLCITIYLRDEKLWCQTSEHLKDGSIKGEPFIYETGCTLVDLEKFISDQKPKINTGLN